MAAIAALEERKLEYILGVRERSSVIIRRFVLEDEAPLTPLLVERARGETELFVKEVELGAARYILRMAVGPKAVGAGAVEGETGGVHEDQ